MPLQLFRDWMHQFLKIKFLSIVLLTLFCSCKEYNEIEFQKISNMKVVGFSKGNLMLQGDAVFYNPNPQGARLKEAEIEIYIKGRKSAVIHPSKKTHIKGKSTFEIPIDAQISLKDPKVLGNVLGIFGKSEVELDFKGYIIVSKWWIPSRIEISERQKVSF